MRLEPEATSNENPWFRGGWYVRPGLRAFGFLILVLSVSVADPIGAQSGPDSPDRFTLGASFFDVSGKLGSGVAFEIGYLPTWRVSTRIRPRLGGMLSSDGAAYAYLGLQAPLSLHPKLRLVPSFAVGAFSAGRGSELGSALEFRSAIELVFRLPGEDAINLSFYHLSNAGVGEENPGLELVGLAYSFAL